MTVLKYGFAGLAGLALSAILTAAALAQPASSRRITGTIERADNDTIVVRPETGGDALTVHLIGNVAVFGVSKAALANIKPGAFIGVGAMPQSDGSQLAMQIMVFDESQRGLGEGHRPWDRAPNTTMTNGTVDATVGSVDGEVLTVKYSGGEQRIVVPPDAVILAYSVGSRSELKAGAKIAIIGAKPGPDGTLEAGRVNVGRGDVAPR